MSITDIPQDELISAYLDGELDGQELVEVERLLAEDPAARRLADTLTEVSAACRSLPPGKFSEGLAQRVVAEAQRRVADGADKPMAGQVDRLEPEGEFGLPFGRSARGWVWAGVAAAAAVMISFYGRPEPPPRQNTIAHRQTGVVQPAPTLTRVAWDRIREAAPQARFVTVKTPPEGLASLQSMLKKQGIQLVGSAPQPARRLLDSTGLSVDAEANNSADEQLMLISTNPKQGGGFVNALEDEGSLFQVEAEQPENASVQDWQSQANTQPGVALRLKTPAELGSTPVRKINVAPGTIVLRIVVVRPQQVGAP